MQIENFLDRNVMNNWFKFVQKYMLRDNMVAQGINHDTIIKELNLDYALHPECPYFNPDLFRHDRVEWAIKNVLNDDSLSFKNKIANIAFIHLLDVENILQIFTNPELKENHHHGLLIDFERVNHDEEYRNFFKNNFYIAKKLGYSFWGTRQLHTPIQQNCRYFYQDKYKISDEEWSNNKEWNSAVEWWADFINKPDINYLFENSNKVTMKQCYETITSHKRMGPYFTYHMVNDFSIAEEFAFNTDERFCVPGPGSRNTLDKMFPNIGNKYTYEDRILFLRENQQRLGIVDDTNKMFIGCRMNEFDVYGLEVSTCQFSIYERLKEDPKKVEKRIQGNKPPVLTNMINVIELF